VANELNAWQVTSQVHDQVINTDAGQTVTGSYVYFLTNLGETASVFIPDNEYAQVQTTKTKIDEHARRVNQVRRLTSESKL
jgi:hypothetical protein